jgi:hypothetical protein
LVAAADRHDKDSEGRREGLVCAEAEEGACQSDAAEPSTDAIQRTQELLVDKKTATCAAAAVGFEGRPMGGEPALARRSGHTDNTGSAAGDNQEVEEQERKDGGEEKRVVAQAL